MDGYRPRLSPERVDLLRQWHDDASAGLHALGAHSVTYLALGSPPITGCSTWAAGPVPTRSSPHRSRTTWSPVRGEEATYFVRRLTAR